MTDDELRAKCERLLPTSFNGSDADRCETGRNVAAAILALLDRVRDRDVENSHFRTAWGLEEHERVVGASPYTLVIDGKGGDRKTASMANPKERDALAAEVERLRKEATAWDAVRKGLAADLEAARTENAALRERMGMMVGSVGDKIKEGSCEYGYTARAVNQIVANATQELRERLAKVVKYVMHRLDCNCAQSESYRVGHHCTCGLADVLKEVSNG